MTLDVGGSQKHVANWTVVEGFAENSGPAAVAAVAAAAVVLRIEQQRRIDVGHLFLCHLSHEVEQKNGHAGGCLYFPCLRSKEEEV